MIIHLLTFCPIRSTRKLRKDYAWKNRVVKKSNKNGAGTPKYKIFAFFLPARELAFVFRTVLMSQQTQHTISLL